VAEISGLVFEDSCQTPDRPLISRPRVAFVVDYYRKMRLSRRPEPLLVTIYPDLVLECFLLGLRAATVDPATRIYQFQLSLAVIPDPRPLQQAQIDRDLQTDSQLSFATVA
jgi:hypothetical protein